MSTFHFRFSPPTNWDSNNNALFGSAAMKTEIKLLFRVTHKKVVYYNKKKKMKPIIYFPVDHLRVAGGGESFLFISLEPNIQMSTNL